MSAVWTGLRVNDAKRSAHWVRAAMEHLGSSASSAAGEKWGSRFLERLGRFQPARFEPCKAIGMCLEFLEDPEFASDGAYNAWYKACGHVDFDSFAKFGECLGLIPTATEGVAAPMTQTSDAVCQLHVMRLGNAHVSGPRFVDPAVVEEIHMPDFGFLIEHRAGGTTRRFLFDLGMRQDGKPLKEVYAKRAKRFNFTSAKGPEHILQEQGYELGGIEGIVTSHTHYDHIGDLAAFPTSAKLIQGVQSAETAEDLAEEFDVPLASIKERKVTVLQKDDPRWKSWGAFKVIDWLGDGSLFLVNSPGHKKGHMSMVVKVASEGDGKYVVLGGDTCHHICHLSGELKIALYPSEEGNLNRLHSVMANLPEAYRTMARSRRMDQEKNCFVWIAHDHTIEKLLPKGRDFVSVDSALWDQIKGRKIDYE